jgi:hypothetical protein
MENKYYRPEISEFHIGFECEKIIPHTNGGHQISLANLDQKPFIVRDAFDIPRDRVTLSWFRVKYLDKEDIESLKLPNYVTINHILNNTWEIVGTNARIFRGDIKNKSELKRLMKQLNILQ